jgi:hypothetical protein
MSVNAAPSARCSPSRFSLFTHSACDKRIRWWGL